MERHILELYSVGRTVSISSKHVIQFFRVVLPASHDHLHHGHGAKLFQLIFGNGHVIRVLLQFYPLRTQFFHDLIEVPSDKAVGTYKHGLSCDRRALIHASFVVFDEILGNLP